MLAATLALSAMSAATFTGGIRAYAAENDASGTPAADPRDGRDDDPADVPTDASTDRQTALPAAYTYVSVSEKGELLPPGGDALPDSSPTGDKVTLRTLSDGTELYSKKWDQASGSVEFSFPADAFEDGMPDSVAFGLRFSGNLTGEFSPVLLNCILTAETSEDTYAFYAPVEADSPAVFAADAGLIPKDEEIRSVKLSLSYAYGDIPSGFLLINVAVTAPISAEEADFSAQQALGIPSLAVLDGTVRQADGKLILSPNTVDGQSKDGAPRDGEGNADAPGNSGVSRILITASGVGASDPMGRILSGNSSDKEGADSPRVAYCALSASSKGAGTVSIGGEKESVLSAGESGQTLRFTYSEGDVGITLAFTGTDSVSLSSVRFYRTGEYEQQYLASLSTLTVRDGEVTAEGGLKSGTAKLLEKCKLHLYAVPFSGGEPVLLATEKVSSRFSFSASVSALPRGAAENYFYVVADDGESVTVLTPLCFASYGTTFSATDTEITGLFGCAPVGIYESGSPNVVVDVYLDRLMGGSAAGTAISHGGTTFTLNNSYVSELDKDIRFYRAAGTAVALRLLLSAPVTGAGGEELTFGGNGKYTLRADTAGGTDLLLAAVGFLSGRYPNINSLILFSELNSILYESGLSAWELADNAGMLMRLACGTAAENIPSIYVTLPFESGSAATPPGKTPDDNGEICDVLAALVSEKLTNIGGVPWAVMLSSPEASTVPLEALLHTGRQSSRSLPSFGIFMWIPSAEGEDAGSSGSMDIEAIAEKYAELCNGSGNTVRMVILSLEMLAGKGLGADEYAVLEQVMKAKDITVSKKDAENAARFDFSEIPGSCTLWDFSGSYSTHGWFDGSGLDFFGTVGVKDSSGEPSGGRVLRSTLSDTGRGDAGVLLNFFDTPIDLSVAPYVEFVFSVTDSSGDLSDAEVVFIFHDSGGHRAEFHMDFSASMVNEDGSCRVLCDLSDSEYAGGITSLGIVIFSDGGETVDMRQINAYSRTLTGEELAAAVFRGNEELSRLPVNKIIIAAFTLAITLFASIGFAVRVHRSEKERRKALIAAAKHSRPRR